MEVGRESEGAGLKLKLISADHPEKGVEDCGMAAEDEQPSANKGMAPIKSEYLIRDRARIVNLDFVSKDDRKRLADESDLKNGRQTSKKLKGQNKHRSRDARPVSAERLCPSVIQEQTCRFGDGCRLMHDVTAFTSNRKEDIRNECYVFRTFGRCPQGLSCRFGSDHLTSEFKNVVNADLWTKHEGHRTIRNFLTKEVQISLRKRNYDFQQADLVTKTLPAFLESKKRSSAVVPGIQSKPDILSDAQNNSDVLPNMQSESSVPSDVHSEAKVLASDSTAVPSAEVRQHHCNDVICYLGHSTQEASVPQGVKPLGSISDEDFIRPHQREIKRVDFRNKLYLAPLTTVGNLPFRRICKRYGADITCGEMAMAQNLLQGAPSEWALLKRHESEDIFGIQVCGAYPDQMTRCAQLLTDTIDIDFMDINVGCPIDLVYRKGAGCGLMGRVRKFEQMVYGMRSVLNVPLTVKIRTGIYEGKSTAHVLVPQLRDWGVSMVTMHGRSREQRYTKSADWSYIDQCAKLASPMPFFGCGDVLSFEDANQHFAATSVSGLMIARGALIKPWIFTEIKEQRHWDISSRERLDLLRDYVHYGLEHWGSDSEGVEKTRRFLLEWLSFLYRYIPVALLERLPQKINERPPYYRGRDDLETLFASPACSDWIKISEMLLGPVPDNFMFLPKHKANSYS